MKKFVSKILMIGLISAGLWFGMNASVEAAQYRIPDGVEVGGIDLSGMTSDEAKDAISKYTPEEETGK